jgi:hypothetical protein
VLQQINADVETHGAPHAGNGLKYRYVSFNHLLAAGVTGDRSPHRASPWRSTTPRGRRSSRRHRDAVRGRPATVFRIDTRTLGWHEPAFASRMPDGRPVTLWDLILLEYPYGTLPTASPAYRLTLGNYLVHAEAVRPILYVRGDWLTTAVTRSPLYEDLLRLPFDLKVLEQRLGVNADANVEEGWLGGPV